LPLAFVPFFRLRPVTAGDGSLSLGLGRLVGVQQKVMLRNHSSRKVNGPFWLEVDNQRHSVRLLGPGEKAPEVAKGSRYSFLQVPGNSLAPGGQATVVVRFRHLRHHRVRHAANAT
jgi:hypothetical protein